MDAGELADFERQAAEIAAQAGRTLLPRLSQRQKVEWKGKKEGHDPVTDADREVEAYVRDELARRFPSHAIVGEEGAGEGSEPNPLTWVVDPLDGTTNFLNGLPAFACSLALLERGRPVVGAIFIPWPAAEGGLVLRARAGGGAWVGDRRLSLSGDPPSPGELVVVPRGPFRIRSRRGRSPAEPRSVGSIAYELAATALGVYRFVLFSSPKVWDVAAGILLVEEAGGRVVTLPRDTRSWAPFDFFAADPQLPATGEPALPGQEAFRGWAQPVLAGTAPAVERAASAIVPYHPLLMRLFRLIGRLIRLR
jgi:myo-inositol-1(or 4)-monophosphatase